MDADLYDRVTVDRERGWLASQVRAALVAADGEVARPDQGRLVDLGSDEPASEHRFRRGQVLDTRHVNGAKQKLHECSCGCGRQRWS